MSQSIRSITLEVTGREHREPPELPLKPIQVSPAAIEQGTSFTILFLALENFSNRYPDLKFTRECMQSLRAAMTAQAEGNPALHHEVRTFVANMPLDAISQSAHPKRIKQLLLESILSPDVISEDTLRTDPQEKRVFGLHDIARDIQYYTRLCELSSDALNAREALSCIMKRATLLDENVQQQLHSAIESFSFKFLTDKTFCLNQKRAVIASPAAPQRPVASAKPQQTLARPNDVALTSILLFRQFEKLSKPVVSSGGETYESIQRRVQDQQQRLGDLKNECQNLGASTREEIYRHVTSIWPRFSRGEATRLKRQGSFLDFLSNPA